jgi:hypothetical protein
MEVLRLFAPKKIKENEKFIIRKQKKFIFGAYNLLFESIARTNPNSIRHVEVKANS